MAVVDNVLSNTLLDAASSSISSFRGDSSDEKSYHNVPPLAQYRRAVTLLDLEITMWVLMMVNFQDFLQMITL